MSLQSALASYSEFAETLLRQGDRPRAAAVLRKAYECEPGSLAGKYSLARACFHELDMAAAELTLREILAHNPHFFEAYKLLGHTLQQLGRFQEAEEVLTTAIELEPLMGLPYQIITAGRRMGPEDRALIERMRSILQDRGIAIKDACSLHYALGKALDDLGEYEAALGHYDQANQLALQVKLRGRRFDLHGLKSVLGHAEAVFTKEFFACQRALGTQSDQPIFIVGMLRSGTTLVEQILSSHPDVQAGGELPFWTRKAPRILDETGRVVNEPYLKESQDSYLKLLRGLSKGKPRVTDKRPGNCNVLGQIHIALPMAKIIHCKRDPVDTALSIYMTPNTAAIDFGYVRENIVFAYKEYQKLMKHYRAVLPTESMIEVQYEEIVSYPEPTIRSLIDFLGLDWNEACLRPEANTRVIDTPTLWQARQPIYGTSVKRWKRYEPWLGAFKELIED